MQGMDPLYDMINEGISGANTGTGQIFYVDSGVSGGGQTGLDWTNAVTTIDAAIGLCTASRGDVIYVAQGHTETSATAADVVTLDVAGVSVIGLGSGALVPTLTLGHADTTVTVSAASCRISNIKIISDVADAAAGITAGATADGLVVDNCWLTDGAAAKELVIGISVAAACDNVKIMNNRFYTVPAGGCASAIKLAGESAQSVIMNNLIQGDYSASCIDGTTAASTLLTISDNYLINIDTTAGSCIDMHASTTGMTCNNRMMSGKSIADTWIADGMVSIENYGTGAVSASGLVEPAVDSD